MGLHMVSVSHRSQPIEVVNASFVLSFTMIICVTECEACLADANGTSEKQQLLEASQLSDMGQLFLHVLTTMKHNGAVDKTQDGFTALVRR